MYPFVKRFFDILISLTLLTIFSPLLLIVALLLSITGEREIFYKQPRVGLNGRIFGIIKFATMLKDSLNLGNKTITVKNDPRITPFGQILRKTKLNEAPQIINVLNGTMSCVGPRPMLESSFEKYSKEHQSKIVKMTPGITGLGSLVFRDEERLVILCKKYGLDPKEYYRTSIFPYKGSLEAWYSENQSFKIDFLLVMLTFWYIPFSNSSLIFKLIPNIPPKPNVLSEQGIQNLAKSLNQ